MLCFRLCFVASDSSAAILRAQLTLRRPTFLFPSCLSLLSFCGLTCVRVSAFPIQTTPIVLQNGSVHTRPQCAQNNHCAQFSHVDTCCSSPALFHLLLGCAKAAGRPASAEAKQNDSLACNPISLSSAPATSLSTRLSLASSLAPAAGEAARILIFSLSLSLARSAGLPTGRERERQN